MHRHRSREAVLAMKRLTTWLLLACVIALAIARPAMATPPLCSVTGNIYPIPPTPINVDFISICGANVLGQCVPQVIGTSSIPPNTLFHSITDGSGNIGAVSIPQGLQ